MILINAKGPATLQGIVSHIDAEFPIDRRYIWIGRGEELIQKESQLPPCLSQAVSRVHACLSISPAFFYPKVPYPSFLPKITLYSSLPNNLLALIWHFCQSPPKIILRDQHSIAGIFSKINTCIITAGLQVVLSDSRPIIFHNRQIYNTPLQLGNRLKELVGQGYVVMNPGEGAVSFWIVSFKNCRILLLDLPGKILIGRSSDCHLTIAESSISRKHAYLEYFPNGWLLGDGDGTALSVNGVWIRTKKIIIDYRKADSQFSGGEKLAKIGDVLLTFNIKEQHSFLGVGEHSTLSKSTDQSFHLKLRKELNWKQQQERSQQGKQIEPHSRSFE